MTPCLSLPPPLQRVLPQNTFIMFLISISIFCLLFFFVMYARLVRPIKTRWFTKALLGIPLLFISFSPFYAMRSGRWIAPDSPYSWTIDFSFVIMVFAILLFFFVIFRDLVAYVIKLFRYIAQCRRAAVKNHETKEAEKELRVKEIFSSHLQSRREFIYNMSSLSLVGAAALVTPITYHEAKSRRLIRREVLYFPNLPPSMEGFTIAHLSDIHAGHTIKKKDIEGIVAQTNALNPDLIAITGDVADGYPSYICDELSPLANLSSTHGTFYCCGNHENMWDGEGWRKCIQSYGIHVLINDHLLIQRDASVNFAVAGAIDYRGDRRKKLPSSPTAALANIPKESFKIMLVHQPKSVNESVENGADLVLLGHTHGGQFFPITLLIPHIHEYAHGVYQRKNALINVSCGTGYWGPPMRLGMSAEIVHLTLRKSKTSTSSHTRLSRNHE